MSPFCDLELLTDPSLWAKDVSSLYETDVPYIPDKALTDRLRYPTTEMEENNLLTKSTEVKTICTSEFS